MYLIYLILLPFFCFTPVLLFIVDGHFNKDIARGIRMSVYCILLIASSFFIVINNGLTIAMGMVLSVPVLSALFIIVKMKAQKRS